MTGSELIRQLIFNFWSHKLRTALALVGIIWGTIAVILLLSISSAFTKASKKNLAFLNNGTILGFAASTTKSYRGMPQGTQLHIRQHDYDAAIPHLDHLLASTPVYADSKAVQFGNVSGQSQVQGVSADYMLLQNVEVQSTGRFFDQVDLDNHHLVAFINNDLEKSLSPKKSLVGMKILISGIPFTVIGVQKKKDNGMMVMGGSVYIPYTTFLAIWGQKDIDMLMLLPTEVGYSALLKSELKSALAFHFHYDPTDTNAIDIPDFAEAQVFFKWFFRIIQLFLTTCGFLTLSVGGVGIANMMFLILTERTAEIGLRMALGAQQSQILRQFLIESGVLVGIGGAIGIAFSTVVIVTLQQLSLPSWLGRPELSLETMMIALSVLFVVAFLAGFFPARRAANMNPVTALAF